MASRRAAAGYWAAALLGFSFLVYANSFPNQFLYGDDQGIVTKNDFLSDWKYLPRILTDQYIAGSHLSSNFYRPGQILTYALVVHAFGRQPWAFHAVSVLFHGLCAVLVFLLLMELVAAPKDAALMAALAALWAAHPVHAEEIAVTTGLATPAYTAGMLGAVFLFVKGLRRGAAPNAWTAGAFACFVFALGFKESAVVLPALLAGAHWLLLRRKGARKANAGELALLHAPFWLAAGVYVVLRLTALNFGNTLDFYPRGNDFTRHLSTRVWTLLAALGRGLALLALPVGLKPDRAWPFFASPFHPIVILSAAALAAILAGAWAARAALPAATLGVLWFFVCYAPFSNIVAKINAVFLDHWLYAPSIGLLFSGAALLRRVRSRLALPAVAAVALAFGVQTFARCSLWRDSEVFFRYLLRQGDQSARNWTNYGIALMDRKDYGDAARAFELSIAAWDNYPQTHHDLARAYLALGKPEKAEAEFKNALRMDHDFYYSRLELGRLYAREKRFPEALEQFEAALKIAPDQQQLRQVVDVLKSQMRPAAR